MNKEHLRYHRHLGQIADADLNYIKRKDVQYDASWKKRGGPGAWFTIVRPWDRLESFMRQPKVEPPATLPVGWKEDDGIPEAWGKYDILGAIEREGLAGPDGSVIACVRDLRRYLLLVEAEATERLTARSGEELLTMDYAEIERRILAWAQSNEENGEMTDLYAQMAQEFGITRQQVKLRLFERLYDGKDAAKSVLEIGREVLARQRATSPTERSVPRYGGEPAAPGTPGDGGQHASLFPWVAGWGNILELGPVAQEAWNKMGQNCFVLLPRIDQRTWSALPIHVRSLYRPVWSATLPDGVLNGKQTVCYAIDHPTSFAPTSFWLNIGQCPEDERIRWPKLAGEQNATEWLGLMEFQELYEWHPTSLKFIVRPKHAAWTT